MAVFVTDEGLATKVILITSYNDLRVAFFPHEHIFV